MPSVLSALNDKIYSLYFRKNLKESFTFFLEGEVTKDLEAIIKISSVPVEKRGELANALLNILREKYNESEKSRFPYEYNSVSKDLRSRYDEMYKKITEHFSS